jgi:pyruvate/2-oxoglutarate dehydrogenase complex dihydrolipoamide acyltransferase (E2) component
VDGDDVVARQTVPLFLSSDHRIVDGMTGVQFYQIVKEYLQDPYLLLAD